MSRSRLLLLAGAVTVTVAVLVGWLVVDRGTDPVSRPPAKVAEPVKVSAESPLLPDADWVTDTASEHLIPRRAMQAYAETELALGSSHPKCHLRWNTVAAIGSVESAHGTLGGAGLTEAGVPNKPIIGPPLNGENGTRAIKATPESTRFHGDETWDHAVGPFQFLTSSWERYGEDADDDGEADPFDIDDAARAAANHLCDAKRDLAGDGWVPAVHAYNNSMAYVNKVRSIANSYAN